MRRDDDYLLDILQAARNATSFVAGKTYEGFSEDVQCHFAVVRAIEIIGEAARNVSDEFRLAHPEIPWRDTIATRNRMIHGYNEVDLAIVWDTVRDDIPKLIALVEPLVPPENELH
jgi:uncharacterized protein with HEPN domain